MFPTQNIIESLPPAAAVRDRLGDALREVSMLRRLLRMAEQAEEYRERDNNRDTSTKKAEVSR